MVVAGKQLKHLESVVKPAERRGRNAFTVAELNRYMKRSDPEITYYAVHNALRASWKRVLWRELVSGPTSLRLTV